MDVFLLLFVNLIPLYVLIGLGWVSGRFFEVERQTLGALGIYIIMPIVAFGFILKLEFQASYIALPIVVYGLLSAMSFFWFWLGKKFYPDKRANLLAMTSVAANTGYMGLPIVLSLFDAQWVAVYIFMMLGGSLYEATTMYYIAARSQFTVRDSLIKLAKFPALYAVVLALILKAFGVEMGSVVEQYWGHFKGAYVVIGMMIIGAALSRVEKLVISGRFISLTFVGQFLMWPAAALVLIALDKTLFHLYNNAIYNLLLVMSFMPPAANIAAFATKLDLNPEKAATTVLIGTIFALFYIPAAISLLGL